MIRAPPLRDPVLVLAPSGRRVLCDNLPSMPSRAEHTAVLAERVDARSKLSADASSRVAAARRRSSATCAPRAGERPAHVPGAVLLEQAQGEARLAGSVVGRCLAEHGARPARPAKDSLFTRDVERGDCCVGRPTPRSSRASVSPACSAVRARARRARATSSSQSSVAPAADDLRDVAEEPSRSGDRVRWIARWSSVSSSESSAPAGPGRSLGRSLEHVGSGRKWAGFQRPVWISRHTVRPASSGSTGRRGTDDVAPRRSELAPHPALSTAAPAPRQVVRADQQVDIGRRTSSRLP